MEGTHSSRSSCSLIVQLWLREMQSQAAERMGCGWDDGADGPSWAPGKALGFLKA